MTTNAYIRGVKQSDWTRFHGKLWQRNYYEHIIRNEHELNKIRDYLTHNPMKWEWDRENTNRAGRIRRCKGEKTREEHRNAS